LSNATSDQASSDLQKISADRGWPNGRLDASSMESVMTFGYNAAGDGA
jgi:hypothetical protein